MHNIGIAIEDINAQDGNGYTALMNIVTDPNAYDLLKNFLINKRPDVNLRNNEGDTRLHLAIKHKAYEKAQLLIDFDANIDLNIKNNQGDTPIMLATAEDNMPMINRLIAKQASLNVRDTRPDCVGAGV